MDFLTKLPLLERSCLSRVDYSTYDTDGILSLISKKSLDLRSEIFQGIFFEYSTDRVKAALKSNVVIESLTYGDIEFFSFYDILLRANPKPGHSSNS